MLSLLSHRYHLRKLKPRSTEDTGTGVRPQCLTGSVCSHPFFQTAQVPLPHTVAAILLLIHSSAQRLFYICLYGYSFMSAWPPHGATPINARMADAWPLGGCSTELTDSLSDHPDSHSLTVPPCPWHHESLSCEHKRGSQGPPGFSLQPHLLFPRQSQLSLDRVCSSAQSLSPFPYPFASHKLSLAWSADGLQMKSTGQGWGVYRSE